MQNVKDSDATVIIYFDKLRGGTEQTVRFCIERHRAHKLIDAAEISAENAAQIVAEFVREEKISTLNVAGPRPSEWSQGYDYAFQVLDISCSRLKL